MIGREEKEGIARIEDTYPCSRPYAHHHWPHQNQKPVSSQLAHHQDPQRPPWTPRQRKNLR